jgi:hypothetical protein
MSDGYFRVTLEVEIPKSASSYRATVTFDRLYADKAGAALAWATRLMPDWWSIIDSSVEPYQKGGSE